MKRLAIFLLSLALGIGVFWLIVQSVGWGNIVAFLDLVSGKQAAALIGVSVLVALSNVWRWSHILSVQGYTVPWYRLTDLWVAGFALNYLTPVALVGGEVVTSSGLRERRPDIPFRDTLASVIILRIFHLTATAVLLVAGLFVFVGSVSSVPDPIANWLAVAILAIIGGFGLFYRQLFQKKSLIGWMVLRLERVLGVRHKRALKVEESVLRFFHEERAALRTGFGMAMVTEALNMLRFMLVMYFLAGTLPAFAHLLALFSFARLAYLAALPATLGSLEATSVFVLGVLGYGGDLGTAFSLVVRGTELAVTLAGLVFLVRLWCILHSRLWNAAVSDIIHNESKPR